MEIIDLPLQLQDGLKTFAPHPRFPLLGQVTYEFSASRYQPPCEGFASKLLIGSDHGGTHVEAPFHFIKGGKDIYEVPLKQLMGPPVCLDVSDRAPDTVIDSAMLAHRCEERTIEIRPGDIVLFRAFSGQWGDPGFHEWQGINDGVV